MHQNYSDFEINDDSIKFVMLVPRKHARVVKIKYLVQAGDLGDFAKTIVKQLNSFGT